MSPPQRDPESGLDQVEDLLIFIVIYIIFHFNKFILLLATYCTFRFLHHALFAFGCNCFDM